MSSSSTIPEPSASRREQKKAETKQNLIEAAIELFIGYGPEAATVQAITKRAGVSTRTFHNYFERRDDVFAYYLHEVFEHFACRIREIAANHPTGRIVDIMRDAMWIYCFPPQGEQIGSGASNDAAALPGKLGSGQPGSGQLSETQLMDPAVPDIRKFKPLLIMLENPQDKGSGEHLDVDLPTLTEPGTKALCDVDPDLSPFKAFLLLDVSFSIAMRAVEAAADERLSGGLSPQELYDQAFDMLARVERTENNQ
ncbi:TetR family transcriptional regulator [Corynebacterium jeikeium]|uniref:Putative transcriptional regulator (TetR family) n=1 Tax=Corynebacterium jeikeium (strain K411) TaxID=306537 RepID=Q4JU33_CORJK|nr:TetR/AcrR family transcriptional regulator [Corynebacterium jeikeium]CAI37674.1 putative transcriptional regulator (TetR family) [Corynebacterium jeikeium K411]SUY84981.1 TetR family transcriptional regulator [Corynebacterium jeikeium]